MKHAPILLPCLACCLLTLTGCFHKDSSYEPGQNEIVSRLAGTEWVREYDLTSPDATVREAWTLHGDGSGTRTIATHYADGKSEEETTYFAWLFTSVNYNVVYMNYPCYWLILELTRDRLRVQQSSKDPDRLMSNDPRIEKVFAASTDDDGE